MYRYPSVPFRSQTQSTLHCQLDCIDTPATGGRILEILFSMLQGTLKTISYLCCYSLAQAEQGQKTGDYKPLSAQNCSGWLISCLQQRARIMIALVQAFFLWLHHTSSARSFEEALVIIQFFVEDLPSKLSFSKLYSLAHNLAAVSSQFCCSEKTARIKILQDC